MSQTPVYDHFHNSDLDWKEDFIFFLQKSAHLSKLGPQMHSLIKSYFSSRAPLSLKLSQEDQSHLQQTSTSLDENGFVRLGTLMSPDEIAEVHSYFQDKLLSDPWRAELGLFERCEDAPQKSHVLSYNDVDVLNAPHLSILANHPLIIGTMQEYLGTFPIIEKVTAWWSLKGRQVPEEAQLFHGDYHGCRFAKLFVYLTDVDEQSGPHVYVPGTHRPDIMQLYFEHLKQRLPLEAKAIAQQFNKEAQGNCGRLSDEIVEKVFGKEHFEVFMAEAGNAFLENTSGLHKGQMPKDADRLIFQVIYTAMPNYKDVPEVASLSGYCEQLEDFFQGIYTRDQLKFINQRIVNFEK